VEIASANAEFLLSELQANGRLLRSWRAEKAAHNAYLEDYAALALGLLALYQSDPQARWYAEAERLAEEMLAHFSEPAGGFFDTRDDHEQLVTRPKQLQDNATPSGNSLAATALLQLAAYSGKGDWHDLAAGSAAAMQKAAEEYPTAFAQWLNAMSFALAEGREIAIVGAAQERRGLLDAVWGAWRPFDVVAAAEYPPEDGGPALLMDRPLVDGKASAYVCRHFVCARPVTGVEELEKLLS
jgi:uncharacterized protein YyaL (SSP411 family)